MSKKHKKHHKSDRESHEDKPLKLVLKVGESSITSENPEAERRHKHKKKKKKHKHERDKEHKKDKEKRKHSEVEPETVPMETAEPESAEPAPKKPFVAEVIAPPARQTPPPRPQKERKFTEEEKAALQNCLDYLYKILSRKDVNGFFSYPVTDQIAPGYSTIIKYPMDLSTMREKLENREYSTVFEFKRDFRTMCENCMTYNHPETIFYKEAKKLLSQANKQMTRDKLIQMKKNLDHMSCLNDAQLGMEDEETVGTDADESLVVNVHTQQVISLAAESPHPLSPATIEEEEVDVEDEMDPQEILAQAKAAARGAADRLTLRKPNSRFGFLKRRADGSTTLNLLNTDNDGVVSEKERIVTLGSLAGKIQSGSGVLAGFKEDKRNKASTINYLNYGPFSSYAPIYDSSTANISKEDSDLLLTTYGDEVGIQYAKSMEAFVKDAGDYSIKFVDNFLDALTGNEHSKAKEIILEREKREAEEKMRREEEEKRIQLEKLRQEAESLRNLSDLGIDVSFLDPEDDKSAVQQRLQETSKLLGELEQTQRERLSQPLPSHLGQLQGPSEKETKLASKLTEDLTDLIGQAAPGDVISPAAVRGALGIADPPPGSEVTDITSSVPQLQPEPLATNLN